MPVGATIGAAVIGAGAGIYGSSQASHAQSQAAQTASGDQLAATEQNNQLATNIYNANAARLDPYSAMGLPAGGEFNALLGIASPAAANPASAPPPLAPVGTGPAGYTGPSLEQIMGMQHDGIPGNYQAAMAAYQAAQASPSNAAASIAMPSAAPAAATPTGTPAATGTAAPASNNALAGFQTFYNSPTYQVPLAAGLKGVNTKYAAAGALESGAAMKAINDYAAGNASQALGTYMDQLYRQEALGEGASAALAGVGQNMVGQVSANNNAAASAAGNAALVAGNGTASMWNTIGSGIGTAAGSIAGAMGSSYSPNNALAYSGGTPMAVTVPTAQPYPYMPGGF